MSVNQTVSGSASLSARNFSLRTFWIGGAILAAIVIGLRIYEQAFGWSAGLDSFSEDYRIYWHTLLVVSIPVSVLAAVAVGAYAYAVTRLPFFSKGVSLPFGLLLVGTFMTIPNIGLNEWGHTFWVLDEGFASPLHWGFAFFGWMALGSFGVTLQILARVRELLGPEYAPAVSGRRK